MAIHIAVKFERISDTDIFRSVSVDGHQQIRDGALGLLCTSVSFLFRTVANCLANMPDIDVKLLYPQRGMLTIDIHSYSLETTPALSTIHNVILQGIHDLKHEYPHEIYLQVIKI